MAAPMNFAAAAEKKTEDTPLRIVQLDGHVVLKIVKHCKEGRPTLVTGQLLGLDVGQTLEVTDCFPFPVSPCRPGLNQALDSHDPNAPACMLASSACDQRSSRMRRAKTMRRMARPAMELATSWT